MRAAVYVVTFVVVVAVPAVVGGWLSMLTLGALGVEAGFWQSVVAFIAATVTIEAAIFVVGMKGAISEEA